MQATAMSNALSQMDKNSRASRPYLSDCSDAFIEKADVQLIVGDETYPAHSQLLAYRSDVMRSILEDCTHCSAESPLVLSEAFSQHGPAATEVFLKHIYQHQPVSSHEEAQQLVSMAHFFDAPSLTRKAVAYMEDTENLLQATCRPDGAVYWLLLADRFDLTHFKQQCMSFTVKHFHVLQRDDRIQDLQPATCLALMRALQAKMDKHDAVCPGVSQTSTPAFSQGGQVDTFMYRGFSQPPAFGASFGQTSAPAFGQASAHAFGASASQTSTPAFGVYFSQTSAPAFGQASAPAFGARSSHTSTPAFGANSSQTSTPANSSQTSTPAFGSGFSQTSAPAFA